MKIEEIARELSFKRWGVPAKENSNIIHNNRYEFDIGTITGMHEGLKIAVRLAKKCHEGRGGDCLCYDYMAEQLQQILDTGEVP